MKTVSGQFENSAHGWTCVIMLTTSQCHVKRKHKTDLTPWSKDLFLHFYTYCMTSFLQLLSFFHAQVESMMVIGSKSQTA